MAMSRSLKYTRAKRTGLRVVWGYVLCSRVVLNLMEGLHSSGFHLYTDNFYTSPLLFHHLYNRGINACGTACSNQKHFPQDLVTRATVSNRSLYDWRASETPPIATYREKCLDGTSKPQCACSQFYVKRRCGRAIIYEKPACCSRVQLRKALFTCAKATRRMHNR